MYGDSVRVVFLWMVKLVILLAFSGGLGLGVGNEGVGIWKEIIFWDFRFWILAWQAAREKREKREEREDTYLNDCWMTTQSIHDRAIYDIAQ